MNPEQAITRSDVLEVMRLLRPWATRASSKIRVGAPGDGGYVVPSCALDCDAVVSVGIGCEASFDLALAEAGAQVLQFDHTIERPPVAHANLRFERKGWGYRTEEDLLGFGDILDRLDALRPRRALLKFDVEGTEYETVPHLDGRDLARFQVIVCELHFLDALEEPPWYDMIHGVLVRLHEHHRPVHLHVNNFQPITRICGIPVPRVAEMSWLRKDLDDFPGPSSDRIPGPLDRPNHPGRPDLCLDFPD